MLFDQTKNHLIPSMYISKVVSHIWTRSQTHSDCGMIHTFHAKQLRQLKYMFKDTFKRYEEKNSAATADLQFFYGYY